MKIIFFGALANNTYVVAQAFQRQGVDAFYIKDIADTFPFSQPVWEDKAFILPYEKIDSQYWTRQKWEEFEKENHWEKPSYIIDPLIFENDGKKQFLSKKNKNIFLNFWYLKKQYRKNIIHAMQDADCLVVCGIEATILAWASGKPFVILPHGGDIRFASGIGKKILIRPSDIRTELLRFLLKKSYSHCLWIGTNDPTGVGVHVSSVNYPIRYFPLPMKKRDRVPNNIYHDHLHKIFSSLGISLPESQYYIFIPSRIDYYWKGTDRLLAAIHVAKVKNIHFIFSGWGKDYESAKNQMKSYKNCTFLPFAVSKPILFDIFASVDIVVDQFLCGTYGTSALEAISLGTPVMMYIQNDIFQEKGWLPPPVINVKFPDDIAKIFIQIDNGYFDFDKCSKDLLSWFDQTHNENTSVTRIVSQIRESILYE